MPVILDFEHTAEPQDLLHQLVQALVEGRVVGLPLETTYVAAAGATDAAAVERLLALPRSEHGGFLAVASREALADFVPALSEDQERLTSRCCPGPVVLQFDSQGYGLTDAIDTGARSLAGDGNGALRLSVSRQPLVQDILRLLPMPLAMWHRTGENMRSAAAFADAVEAQVDMIASAGELAEAGPMTVIGCGEHSWRVLSPGAVRQEDLKRMKCRNYLFVCTGNTCRSPMAAALFRKRLAAALECAQAELPDRGFQVESAGLAALPGHAASPDAVELLQGMDADLSDHSSQPVTAELISRADLILTMTVSHKATLIREYPDSASRVRTLAPDMTDVDDPIGMGPEEYRRAAEQIDEYLDALVDDALLDS